MRKLMIELLEEGMVIARDIHLPDGKILLSKGSVLKESYISKLKHFEIIEIFIEEDWNIDIVIEDVIKDESRNQAVAAVEKIFKDSQLGLDWDFEVVHRTVLNIIDELMKNKDILVSLKEIRNIDQYTFGHSVNVCILSIITGIFMNYSQKQLYDLGLGALLHDIGKTLIPGEIINKPQRLSDEEFEQIKDHTVLGYNILRSKEEISEECAIIALSHHERYDGKGYPSGCTNEEIHTYAKIVAIADVFDALTSDRAYKNRISNFRAVEYLLSMGNRQFDNNLLKVFLEFIPIFPIGSMVKLNSGESGIVVRHNKSSPTRPLVRLVMDGLGKLYQQTKEVDLTLGSYLYIVDTI